MIVGCGLGNLADVVVTGLVDSHTTLVLTADLHEMCTLIMRNGAERLVGNFQVSRRTERAQFQNTLLDSLLHETGCGEFTFRQTLNDLHSVVLFFEIL